MELSEALLLAFIASIPPTISSLAALVVSLRTDSKAKRLEATTAVIEHRTNDALEVLRKEVITKDAIIAALRAREK